MKWVKKHKVLTVILVFVGLIIIVAAAGGGTTTKTTTTTTKTTDGATTTTTQKSETKQSSWDAQAIYDQINAGMTKAQVEQITGKASDSCSQSAIQGVGTYEYCNYSGGFGAKGTISVVYQDGIVSSKSKLDF